MSWPHARMTDGLTLTGVGGARYHGDGAEEGIYGRSVNGPQGPVRQRCEDKRGRGTQMQGFRGWEGGAEPMKCYGQEERWRSRHAHRPRCTLAPSTSSARPCCCAEDDIARTLRVLGEDLTGGRHRTEDIASMIQRPGASQRVAAKDMVKGGGVPSGRRMEATATESRGQTG
ncbi:hypothetical protein B0H19DRAFT_1073663 [Mycena capillaripes]|nr:hypothetical protein B0H19DRAFT_1073663 [Mycena capillaripes]